MHRILASLAVAWAANSAADYSSHPHFEGFTADMHAKHGFDGEELRALFEQVEQKESILEAIARPAEKTLTWARYQNIFLKNNRIKGGARFWLDNEAELQRAYETYGVAPEIIVAILGVETRYGDNKGGYRVIDALSTLGFDYPPRSDFFRKELEHFLLLAREQEQDPLTLMGSYAGAMGYGQFMPSSYRAYAVDFDGDDFVDIWNNPSDAIGSIANYLARHGWQKDEAVVTRARVNRDYDQGVLTKGLKLEHKVADLKRAGLNPLDSLADDKQAMAFRLEGKQGAEFWVGLKNFEVITRYNRSQLYAMAVYKLGQAIAERHQRLITRR
ncbi:lytic murein transglycosylase B [Gilvimarinus sp. F26214L]|uniref:lytic murein transglycosylase B n=1 Tax=Gilvimarinus sp. DZF01 TaxID=3461371 RepID=UPI0040468300